MRGIVWLVLLFAAAVVAAAMLGRNDGLVTLAWGAWRAELSMNLFVLALVAACTLFVWTLQAVQSLIRLPKRAEEWRALRRERAAHLALREALAEYFAARYGRARKAAQRALAFQPMSPNLAGDTDFHRLAHLLAAGSSHRMQDRFQRDNNLQTALPDAVEQRHSNTSAEEALVLCAAEWALDDRDPDKALGLLQTLSPGAARRTQALRLKMQASRLARQPLVALQTARLLANHQAFSPTVAQGLLRSLAKEALEQVHDNGQLQRLWGQLDLADRRDPQVVASAVSRACQLGAHEQARQWLRPLWDGLHELSPEDRQAVALALIEARSGIGTDWLPRIESAHQAWGHDAAVSAAVGMVLAECSLWGKARGPLAQAAASPSLNAGTRRAAWRQLAVLAKNQGDHSRAQECEHAAAALD